MFLIPGGTFTKLDYILGHKQILINFKGLESYKD